MKKTFRPKFHFAPEKGYMNDPNGCFYDATTSTYNLYFQYSDETSYDEYYGSWVDKNWGHAVSSDLVSFEEKNVAISKDEIGLIWSGSIVIDRENDSGVFPNSLSKDRRIVAFYPCANSHPIKGFGNICVCGAYSLDGGNSFIKFENNPLIKNENNSIANAFGDPKVFYLKDDYYPKGGIWVMLTALEIRIFTSTDLINWKYESDVLYQGKPLSSECPGFFETNIDGKNEFIYSGAGTYFVSGVFSHRDGHLYFDITGEKEIIKRGNMYANQQFVYAPDNRIIMIGWMIDRSSFDLRKNGKTWDGYQTIPMEVTLFKDKGNLKSKFYPVKELEKLRKKEILCLNNVTKKQRIEEFDNIFSECFDLEMEIDVSKLESFEFDFRKGKEEKTRLFFSKEKKEVELNTYLSGLICHEHHHLPVKLVENILNIRLLVDRSAIDVFVDYGADSRSILFFPEEDINGFSFTIDGEIIIKKMEVFDI